MNDRLQDLRSIINLEVKSGFAKRDEIIELALDYLLDMFDYNPDVMEIEAIRMTDELLAQHTIEQQTWLDVTDCDRLDEAFAELDRKGIVARHNFTCCQTCGHAEISYELDETRQYRPVRGYVFYHQQDTESAVMGYGLYLAYGAVNSTEVDSVAIGWEIVDTLRDAGLSVTWNGTINKRIHVDIMDWRWRRV